MYPLCSYFWEDETMGISPALVTIVFGVLAVLVYLFSVTALYRSLYHKVGPNEILVISGGRGSVVIDPDGRSRRIGFRIVKGGGTLVNPLTERTDVMPVGMLSAELNAPNVPTRSGPVRIDCVAQIKVRDSEDALRKATEQFLGKSADQIRQEAAQIVFNHLRAGLDGVTIEGVRGARYAFGEQIAQAASADLANVGMEVVSFTIREIGEASTPVAVS
jgi:flotillin